jgi:hypothetical protein
MALPAMLLLLLLLAGSATFLCILITSQGCPSATIRALLIEGLGLQRSTAATWHEGTWLAMFCLDKSIICTL